MNTSKQGRVMFEQREEEQHEGAPWPEWSDSYINSSTWSRGVKHSLFTLSTSPGKNKPVFEVDDTFDDPAGFLEMPPDIPVLCWKRPHHIAPDVSYVIEPDPVPLDLVTHNEHLLEYEIMRTIISSIACLEREGYLRPFPVEFQSDQFVANGEPEWKPWHHVYALTQAGRGQVHNPQYNPFGKYIIRIFYLGKWRRIVVDDKLPVDGLGQILLPMSRPDNLWLPLLSKALLRVAALSWVPPHHCVDFTVIHCLTGWLPMPVPCKGCSPYHLWCVCCQVMSTTPEVVKAPGCCRSDDQFPEVEETEASAVGSRMILAHITPKENTPLTGIGEEIVLIGGARYDNEQSSPLWKQYRWNEWAYNKKIISEIPHKAVRNIIVFNPMKGKTDNPKPSPESSDPDKNEGWLDFEDFAPSVRSLEVFFKPSFFKYSLRAWSDEELLSPVTVADGVPQRKGTLREKGGGDARSSKSKTGTPKSEKTGAPKSEKTGASGKGSGKGKKGKVSDDITDKLKGEWPSDTRKKSFFYLMQDSMTLKSGLLSISIYSPEKTPHVLFIGRFHWHSSSVALITSRMSTTGTRSRHFMLPPGLRVFRVWYQFPTYFCLQLFSNTNFQSGSKMTIQSSLTCDSVSFKFYGKEISTSLDQLLAAPQGGAAHGEAYQQLMASLHPPLFRSKLPWPQWFRAHAELTQAFEESLTEMLLESVHQPEEIHQAMQAFQLLFLNPVFGMKTLKSIKPDVYDYIMEQKELLRNKTLLLEQELKEQQQLIAAEQKGKKGSKSKKSIETALSPTKTSKPAKGEKKLSDKNKIKPMTEGDPLRKLIQCKEKSLMINDQGQAILLLKRIMSKVAHLRSLYPFYLEDEMRLVFRDYVGEFQAEHSWVVLVRVVLNIHSDEPVPCSLHIWSPLENLVLRLTDNDTMEEVLPLGFVENNVSHLVRNKLGYTVCAYGVADVSKPVVWRLRSMGLQETDCLHVCQAEVENCVNSYTQPTEQYQQTLYGYYVPNKENVIAKFVLEVTSDVTVLLKLHLSNSFAVCRLTLTDEAGEVVHEVKGIGHAMIYFLNLTVSREARESGSEASVKVSMESRSSEGPRGEPQRGRHVYRVRAELLDNSWPLDPQQMRAMLYYKEHLPHVLSKQTDKRTLGTLGSLNSLAKIRKQVSRNLSGSLTQSASSLKSTQDSIATEENDEVFFDNFPDKPSWCLTLVTDLQEVMPVNLRLDKSLFETINELKKEWKNKGSDVQDCQALRHEFLSQQKDEFEEEFTEEVVFKLKTKKLDRLNELYGRTVREDTQEEMISSTSGVTLTPSSSKTLRTPSGGTASTLSSGRTARSGSLPPRTVAESQGDGSQALSGKSSSHLSRTSTQKTPDEEESKEKLDPNNVLVQQAAIHQALQNIRQKTLDHIEQIFKETAELREKIINDMKAAKEAEFGAEKADAKKGKKSKELSPADKKGKKESAKEGKSGSLKGGKKGKGK